MAGIGFELRRFVGHGSYAGLIAGYLYAGVLSSGSWAVSMVGIWMIGALNPAFLEHSPSIAQFQVSATYLVAFSLLVTGPVQLVFSRYVADRLYEKRIAAIVPNLLGTLILMVVLSGLIGLALTHYFASASVLYRVLMVEGFSILCCIWLLMILLSSIKAYKLILMAFLLGYGSTAGLALKLKDYGVEGLLGGFVAGQALMLLMLLAVAVRAFPAAGGCAFEILDRRRIFVSLAWTGLFYGLGIWIDKILFWFNPFTSVSVIGPLRASRLYDFPIFLAYLSIIPGMASFLLRLETDFSEKHGAFLFAINDGAPLAAICAAKDDMVRALQRGLLEIAKVQGLTLIILLVYAEELLAWFKISPLYRFLFSVDLFGVGIQVLFLAILNILFYLDKRRNALQLTVLLNGGLTLLSQWAGPQYYGFGFGGAMAIATLVGLVLLNRRLEKLEYETFMLQRPGG